MTKFAIHFRTKLAEIDVESDSLESLKKALTTMNLTEEEIEDLFRKDSSKKIMSDDAEQNNEAISNNSNHVADLIDSPMIQVSKSTTENLKELFKTPWGKKPRALSDIASALDTNAAPDRIENIGSALTRLTKQGFLRRVKKDGKWNFFSPPSS